MKYQFILKATTLEKKQKNSLFEYIEMYYNRQRLHSTLNYCCPVQFEQRWIAAKAAQLSAHFFGGRSENVQPLAVRRMVSFCEAVYDREKTVEGITALRIAKPSEIFSVWEEGKLPLLVDPENNTKDFLNPHVLIDVIIAKKNVGTKITDAPLVVGLGP